MVYIEDTFRSIAQDERQLRRISDYTVLDDGTNGSWQTPEFHIVLHAPLSRWSPSMIAGVFFMVPFGSDQPLAGIYENVARSPVKLRTSRFLSTLFMVLSRGLESG